MPSVVEPGPFYVSSSSANLILSDTRPIQLKIDALRCINVLLDEFLYNILSTARSLHTDRLRSSLLSLLPTSLGKEALLEAEVELRAYWDRTYPKEVPLSSDHDDDSKTFSLDWAFELLRLKCEAYSTLNELDADSMAEVRLHERMTQIGGLSPPKQSLVAPASLYLTAILEAMSEHILSNVARVAARDSSRSAATVQDLYIALCEDDTIFSLFKSMKVYEQIEQFSRTSKPRRSKSLRSDKSRASSPQQDVQRARLSLEASTLTVITASAKAPATPPRTSLERAKSMKKFITGSRTSGEDSQNGHRKADSIRSSDTKTFSATHGEGDEASYVDSLEQEFDDLMRSDSTMKVSLTPDRLKTMEVHKQEKDQRATRRPTPLSFNSSDSDSTRRGDVRKSPLHQVDSILEDDEEQQPASLTKSPSSSAIASRARQKSVSGTASTTATAAAPSNRSRSVSVGARLVKKASPHPTAPVPSLPTSLSTPFQHSAAMASTSTMSSVQPSFPHKSYMPSGFPPRTRKIQRNRESIDLDEIMAGSDDDQPEDPPKNPNHPPETPRRTTKVSASTRALMDFLAEGPPLDIMQPQRNASTTSINSGVTSQNGKQKPSGRLQRMMSKLTIGGVSEKLRGSLEDAKGGRNSQPTVSTAKTLNTKPSNGSISPLANRPVLPRPAMLYSSSQGSTEGSPTDSSARNRFAPVTQRSYDVSSSSSRPSPGLTPTSTPPSAYSSQEGGSNAIDKVFGMWNIPQGDAPGHQQRLIGDHDTGVHSKLDGITAPISRKVLPPDNVQQQPNPERRSHSPRSQTSSSTTSIFISGLLPISSQVQQAASATSSPTLAKPIFTPSPPASSPDIVPTTAAVNPSRNSSPVKLKYRKPVPSLLPPPAPSTTPPPSSQSPSTTDVGSSPTTTTVSSPVIPTADASVADAPTVRRDNGTGTLLPYPHISQEAALEMRQLFSRADNADECRVILEMFMARAGIPLSSARNPGPDPTVGDKVLEARNNDDKISIAGTTSVGAVPQLSATAISKLGNSVFEPVQDGRMSHQAQAEEGTKALEFALVDMLLGNGGDSTEKPSATTPQDDPHHHLSSVPLDSSVSTSAHPVTHTSSQNVDA
ncbi:hypothetical protein AX16_007273 [Volvariella volvacea WC 439]|nr:hypothetical protein AX16_007273 [Volvariella volvacea WC 439]